MLEQLKTILGQDNDARKAAEAHIAKIKEGEPDKYASYLTIVLKDAECPADIKVLSAVLLRRALCSAVGAKKETLWELMT